MRIILSFAILIFFWTNTVIAEEYPNSWKIDLLCKQGGSEWYESSYIVNVENNKFQLGPFDNKHWGRETAAIASKYFIDNLK